MKKTYSRRLTITTALFFVCIMITAIGVTYAYFSDRDSKEGVIANMATVDIELQSQSFSESSGTGTASFVITNNSNINIYLRAGIIFELVTMSGQPVIADSSGISVVTLSEGWEAEQKSLADENNTYTKWFLKYGNSTDYTEVSPNANPSAAFTVTGIPDDCKLIVNVVPEAVQVDMGSNALNDFKNSSNINPSW